MEANVLYYGDNLNILRDHIPDESVDLVYLDPPFNSNRSYNVIFKDESKRTDNAQIEAFDDTWHWGPHAEETYLFLTNTAHHQGRVPESVSALVGALRKGIRPSPMLAYLVEMTVRLVELQRVLKPSGSLYLHCDPTASHYLKVVLDAIFGVERFFSEVVWKRWSGHGDAKRYGAIHDVLLFYGKSRDSFFDKQFIPYDEGYVRERFKFSDPDGRRWAEQNLVSPNPRPNLTYEYTASNGVTYRPHRNGWKVTRERMGQLDREGRLHFPPRGNRLRLKVYLDEQPGAAVQDLWTDIYGVGGSAVERLGYPTQKPLALLERVVASATRPGDVVLDPFCGCGTALIAAQKLGRKWVGIDITYLSIAVMRARLHDSFPEAFGELTPVKVIGQPTEVEGARMLARQSGGRKEFELWAVSLVGAQPSGSNSADHGIDGRLTFTDINNSVRNVLVSVKSGHANVAHVRDLIGTMQREDAPLGLFITLEEPSRPMLQEAAEAGIFHSELANRDYQRVQIVTIDDLLHGKKPELPLLLLPTYQQAEQVKSSPGQMEAFG